MSLHDERLCFVLGALLDSGAESVLDLGCGSGTLLKRAVLQKQFQQIVGVEVSAEALAVARRELGIHEQQRSDARLSLINGSYLDENARLQGFDAAALVETIEHVDPKRLSILEKTVFATFRPGTVVVTTPNQEYNVLYGLHNGEFRDPDHRFEWTRLKFRTWAKRIGHQFGYRVVFGNIGEAHPEFGSPTQAARFIREEQQSRSARAG